jgi:hypothetical protein
MEEPGVGDVQRVVSMCAHYWLGVIYEKQGKNAEARGQFQAALHLRPADDDAKQAVKRVS